MEEESKHYHSEGNGCLIHLKDIEIQDGKIKTMPGRYCETHKVNICRCGWEFGHHFDGKEYNTNIDSAKRFIFKITDKFAIIERELIRPVLKPYYKYKTTKKKDIDIKKLKEIRLNG
jgi:hypothetical protein